MACIKIAKALMTFAGKIRLSEDSLFLLAPEHPLNR